MDVLPLLFVMLPGLARRMYLEFGMTYELDYFASGKGRLASLQ